MNRYYGTDRIDTRNFGSNIYNITNILGCRKKPGKLGGVSFPVHILHSDYRLTAL